MAPPISRSRSCHPWVRAAVLAGILMTSACAEDTILVEDNGVEVAEETPDEEVGPAPEIVDGGVASECDAGPPPAIEPGSRLVTIHLVCGEMMTADPDLRAIERAVPSGEDPLSAALTQLFLGVGPDDGDLGSAFSTFTAGTLVSAEIIDGVAVVELTSGFIRATDPAEGGAGEAALAQITATVFELDAVVGLELAVDGERWCGWVTPCDDAPDPLVGRE
ncbi:MAG: GerMN domain-containing protein [Acidimicrobiales bacterium]